MSRAMEDLKDVICRELDEIAEKGELSAGDLETVYKLIVSKEKLLRIEELEEGLGYSHDGGWNAEGSYSRADRYNGNGNGNSYRGRSRDSMGRYSRRGNRYSMAEGREMMAEQLRGMLEDQSLSQSDRQALQRAMEQLQR